MLYLTPCTSLDSFFTNRAVSNALATTPDTPALPPGQVRSSHTGPFKREHMRQQLTPTGGGGGGGGGLEQHLRPGESWNGFHGQDLDANAVAQLGEALLEERGGATPPPPERTPARPARRPATTGSGQRSRPRQSPSTVDTAPRPRQTSALTPASNGASAAYRPSPPLSPTAVQREQMGFSYDRNERENDANGEVVAVPLLTGPDNEGIIQRALEAEVEAEARRRQEDRVASEGRLQEESLRGHSELQRQQRTPRAPAQQRERAEMVGRGGGIVTVNVETGESCADADYNRRPHCRRRHRRHQHCRHHHDRPP